MALQFMFTAIRSSVAKRLEVLAEVAGLALSISGATLAAVFGKFLVAALLVVITLGFFFRLSNRREGRVAAPPPAPLWVRPSAAVLAVVEVTALVEASNLPVRFDSAGFSYLHWILVVVALGAAYVFQVRLFRLFWSKSRALESP
jgi:hypothetical protein